MSDSPKPYPVDPFDPVDEHDEPEEIDWEAFGFEHVAESNEQGDIIFELRSSLRELVRLRGWTRVRTAGDNYFAWSPTDQTRRVSPDAYLLDDPPTGELPVMWLTWLPGHRAPRWAVEIVSKDWRKDYDRMPAKYEELGCQELVLFDPKATLGKTRNRRRVPLTVYRRDGEGRLVRVHSGGQAAWSEQLRVWLQPRRDGYSARLRLSEDEAGTRLVPTEQETASATRQTLDLQKAATEAERLARERAEQQRAESAQALDAEKAATEAERLARRRAEQRIRELEQALREKEEK